MEIVEADLERSKQVREKQMKEYQRQLEEERTKNEQKVSLIALDIFYLFYRILVIVCIPTLNPKLWI